MSADDQGGPGQREVAYRLFAAEYRDADLSYSESEEERAPNYVITPTGARVNRLFVTGVLTETERVNEDMLRARIVDPTGPFVGYAGQYQPDALAFLERTDPPAFVALTGKARTFQPEDSDQVYTSVRPESINAVDADTRDRWVVETAQATLRRVAIFAEALELDARGDDLEAALRKRGIEEPLAMGIPLAIDHYATTTAYLEAVRQLAIDALEVVAGERDEARSLDRNPSEGGEVSIGALPDVDSLEPAAEPTEAVETSHADESTAAGATEATGAVETAETESTESVESDEAIEVEESVETEESAEIGDVTAETGESVEPDEATAAEEPVETSATEPDSTDVEEASETGGLGDFDTGEPLASEETDGEELGEQGEEADESGGLGDFEEPSGGESTEEGMYELDEEERREVEEEFGVEFETGSSVGEPGEADIEVPDEFEEPAEEAAEPSEETAEPIEDTTEPIEETEPESEATELESEPEPEESLDVEELEADVESEMAEEVEEPEEVAETGGTEPPEDLDLETVAVDTMRELADDDGAAHDEVVAAVVDEYGVSSEDVEDAIQEALMNGQCYEPTDGQLKAI